MTLPENKQILKRLGHIIYIKIDPQAAFNRLMNKGMPAYLDPNNPYQSFLKLARAREPIYTDAADIVVETSSHTPEQLAGIILQKTISYSKFAWAMSCCHT